MKKNNILNNVVKKLLIIVVMLTFFIATLVQVSSDQDDRVRYSDLEKEEIGDDDESQEVLQEYYGEILGKVKKKSKFNTFATQGDIVIFNVTINGKDRRILTRLREATITSGQGVDLTNAKLIRTESLIVLGNISLKGNLFLDIDDDFGSRRLFGLGSTNLRYVDEGFSRLVDGKGNVSINPILRNLISNYNVFLSAEGLTRGIYVAEKTHSYFVVKSVNSGSNVGFSWMLRGVRTKYDEGYLVSEYGKGKGISITATINFENGSSKIVITGLNEILVLVNETTISAPDNIAVNPDQNNSINGQGIKLITGNLIDEFGLETELGQILGDATPLSELIAENDQDTSADNNLIINDESNAPINNNPASNGTVIEEISVLEFTLFSTDEDLVMGQISSVTGLNLLEVKKLVNFVYTSPEGFSDEIVEAEVGRIEGIEKINGSVIIRLG